ncbi:MAG: aryl-sulfate sulfotransferase [Planctomycetota bacterium]
MRSIRPLACSCVCLVWLSFAPTLLVAGDPTVGWLEGDSSAAPGYTLFTPMGHTETYLIDNFGRVVHTWSSAYRPGNSVYLREDGMLVRTAKPNGPPPSIAAGGWGGKFQVLDWNSNVQWEYTYSSATVQHHHDIALLPNGNVLVLAWELKSQADAIASGRNPATAPSGGVWPEHVVEVMQTGPTTGAIVWEWHLWDHVIQDIDPLQNNFGVVADHPELIDINQGNNGSDWIHANSIDYNPILDQIMISARGMDEIWIIDHSTTTAEAASHSGGNSGMGGDILYRWGNPQNYGRGTAADQKLFGQHCAEWILPGRPGAGNILIFNNGVNRPGGNATSIDEIAPPVDSFGNYSIATGTAFEPTALTWTYMDPNPTDFYASFISGTRRLPNGNTIICNGPQGEFFEVTTAGSVAWRYRVPVNSAGVGTQGNGFSVSVFRTNRYAPSYPGLAGQTLTPGAPIELYPTKGDFDNDGDIDDDDATCFDALYTGDCTPCPNPIFANAAGYFGDFDDDGDIDCTDWSSFSAAWTGPPTNPPPFAPCANPDFVRGDANNDASINIADAIKALGYLFAGDTVTCLQALDMNDDESTDISDPVYLLASLFGMGPPIAAPTTPCGPDPTPGPLPCTTYPCP